MSLKKKDLRWELYVLAIGKFYSWAADEKKIWNEALHSTNDLSRKSHGVHQQKER